MLIQFLIKFVTSIGIIIASVFFILFTPDTIATIDSRDMEYIGKHTIDERFYAQDNPIVKGHKYEQSLLQGKSISERNKLLYQWEYEYGIALEKAREFNKNIIQESRVLFDKSYYIYIRLFSVVYIIIFGLITYFVKFYKWYDIFYLGLPYYIIIFGDESVVGVEWLLTLFAVYLFGIHKKQKCCSKI